MNTIPSLSFPLEQWKNMACQSAREQQKLQEEMSRYWVGRIIELRCETLMLGGREIKQWSWRNEELQSWLNWLEEEGWRVRMWLPNAVGTADFRQDRCNVEINTKGEITKVAWY